MISSLRDARNCILSGRLFGGAAGHGRRRGEQLPAVEEVWISRLEQRCCTQCQRPYAPMGHSEDIEIVEVEVRAHRRTIRRRRRRIETPMIRSRSTAPLLRHPSLGRQLHPAISNSGCLQSVPPLLLHRYRSRAVVRMRRVRSGFCPPDIRLLDYSGYSVGSIETGMGWRMIVVSSAKPLCQ